MVRSSFGRCRIASGVPSIPAHGRARESRGGFSLIEVLTILAVLGIVSALAAPRLDFHRYQIDGAMQEVGSVMLLAQRAAIQQSHNVVVAFDVANSRVRIHADFNNNGQVDGDEPTRVIGLGDVVAFGRGGAPPFFEGTDAVSFSAKQDGMPAVTFYRNGAASEEGGFHLTSNRAAANGGYASDTRALRIERSTGRPVWFRREGSTWKQEF